MSNKKNTKKEKKEVDPLLNDTFFNKYKTIKKLGQGSFGRVYRAEYRGECYAIKFENRSVKKKLLQMEGIMMTYLQGEQIPYIKLYGYSGEWNLLIMQLIIKFINLFNNTYRVIQKITLFDTDPVYRLIELSNGELIQTIKNESYVFSIVLSLLFRSSLSSNFISSYLNSNDEFKYQIIDELGEKNFYVFDS